MKCEIIPERCIACGLCQIIAPEIFDYTDDGIVLFVGEPEATHEFIPKDQQAAVVESAKRCPSHAILYQDS
ncbi:ferredoxin [Enterococcus pingfangensis]|uniref:ferredoxin n=1 Tax=Enterococcus pingfangensis TaxID=2559924 RepID=UPI0010F5BAAC|nr:ferredoxin [Enterococcus pingfangensis]